MKVTVNSNTVFRFPTRLMVNGITASIVRKKLKKSGILLTAKQTRRLVRELFKYKRTHSQWNIVEIESHNDYTVIITL